MALYQVGMLCIKTRGRDAGRNCVIVDLIDRHHVLVTGPKKLTGVRRRKVNVKHLDPSGVLLKLEKGASDVHVEKALQTYEKAQVKQPEIKVEKVEPEIPKPEVPVKEELPKPKPAAKEKKVKPKPTAKDKKLKPKPKAKEKKVKAKPTTKGKKPKPKAATKEKKPKTSKAK